jgi:lactate racemase
VARDPAGALGEWSSGDAVAVTISDRTRPLDPLPALEALRARVPKQRVIIGLGLHRTMTPDELAPWSAVRPIQHDPDDVVPTKDVRGVPGLVNRAIADAAWCVSVGVAEPHQYAGFSGGHKGVAIGCGGRATIQALHARDRVMDPGVRIGAVTGNPFREIVDGLGEAARCLLALVWVPAAKVWVAGEPRAVVGEASRLGTPWYPVAGTHRNVLLKVPPSKGASLYQASRAATYLALSPNPPLEPGARLVIEAPCPEGLGAEEGFRKALERCRPPWTELLEGPEPTGPGAQRAVILALIAKRYRLVLTGVIDPEPFRAVGIEASPEAATPDEDWLQVPEPFVRIPQRAT